MMMATMMMEMTSGQERIASKRTGIEAMVKSVMMSMPPPFFLLLRKKRCEGPSFCSHTSDVRFSGQSLQTAVRIGNDLK